MTKGAIRAKLVAIAVLLYAPIASAQPGGNLSPYGDIMGVTAGTGLTGGGIFGTVTLNVACGSGLACAADSIAIDGTVLTTANVAGTTGRIAKFTGANTVGDSGIMSESGTTLTMSSIGTFTPTGINSSVPINANLNGIVTPATFGYSGATQTADRTTEAVNNTATFDTTALARTSRGINVTMSSSRSAGANDLTNNAIEISVSGAQKNRGIKITASGATGIDSFGIYSSATVTTGTGYGGYFEATGVATANFGLYATATGAGTNIALRTDAGDVKLNQTGGNLFANGDATFGDATTDILDVNGDTSKFGGTIDGGVYIVGAATNNNSINFEYGTAGIVTGWINRVSYASGTGTFRNLTIGDGKTAAVVTFTGSDKSTMTYGTLNVGSAASFSAQTNGNFTGVTGTASWLRVTAGLANTDSATLAHTTTGNTTSAETVDATHAGSYNTTAGALRATALSGVVSSTRSAGANNLTNYGGFFSATGGQVNYALYTDAGDVVLNATGGTTRIDGTISDSNSDVTIADGLNISGILAATANTSFGDADTDTTTITGNTDVAVNSSTGFFRVKPSVNAVGNVGTINLGGVRTDLAGVFTAIEMKPSMGAGYPSGFVIDTYDSGGSALSNNIISVAPLTLAMTIPNAVTVGSGTIGAGLASIASPDAGTGLAAGTWDNKWTIFGPNVANSAGVSSGALGIGYSTTNNEAQIVSVAPSSGWKRMTFAANDWQFLPGGGNTNGFFITNGTVVGNGAFTLGDSITGDAHAVNGYTTMNGGGTGDVLRAWNVASASTTTGTDGADIRNNGTFDATTGNIEVTGVSAAATATRSAGANNVTNYAFYATATGGQFNYDFYGASGQFYQNDAASFFNTITQTYSGTAGSVMNVAYSGTGQTGARTTINASNSGSFDTTASARIAYGVVGQTTATRSAGANNLTNYGGYFYAGSAQVNIGVYADAAQYSFYGASGVLFNAGNTQLGDGDGDSALVRGTLTVQKTGLDSGPEVLLQNDAATWAVGVYGATSDAFLITKNGSQTSFGINTSGQTYLGDTTYTSIPNNVNVLTIGNTGAGQTANIYGAALTLSPTLDTTAGSLTNVGVNVSNTGARSAGANNLVNYGFNADSSGGQFNYGGRFASGGAASGNNYGAYGQATGAAVINYGVYGAASGATTNWAVWAAGTLGSSGNATLGDATADNHTINGQTTSYETVGTTVASMDGGGNLQLADDTALATGAGGGLNFYAKYTSGGTYSAGAAIKMMRPNATDGNNAADFVVATRPNAGSLTERMRIANAGEIYMGDASSGGIDNNTAGILFVSNTGTGQTVADSSAITATNSGTYNTTSGAINVKAISATVTSTRSAGANNLNNFALILGASGGQTNYAIWTNEGDVWLNNTSGSTTASRDFLVNGGITIGDSAVNDSHVGQGAMLWTTTRNVAAGDAGWRYTYNPTGQTNTRYAFDLANSATIDTTATAYSSYGLRSIVTSSRSAGANVLTNVAGYFSATGGQANTAIEAPSGDVRFNATSGSAWFSGGVNLGDSFADQITLNGWWYTNKLADEDVTNSAVLQADDYLAINVTAGKIYRIIADITIGGSSTTGDYKWDFAVLAGTMDCTGTHIAVSTADAYQASTIFATAAASTSAVSVGTRADASLPIPIHIEIACKVSNTTQLQYRFAQSTATAATVARTMAGSRLIWAQLN